MTRVTWEIEHSIQQGVLLKIKAAEGRLQNDSGRIRMTRVTLDIEHSTQQGVLLKIKAAEGRLQNDTSHIR